MSITLALVGIFCTPSLLLAPTATAPAPQASPTGEFFFNPTPSLLPAITPVPTATELVAETSPASYVDGQDDGVNCQSGEPVTGGLMPEIDIGEAWVERTPVSGAQFVFNLRFPRVADLAAVLRQEGVDLLGGFELYDPLGPIPSPDPDWYFNNTGNLSFNFGWNREIGQLVAWESVYRGGSWVVEPDVFYPIRSEGNVLTVEVPAIKIPSGAKWLAVSTNFASCDVIGLEAGLPSLEFP